MKKHKEEKPKVEELKVEELKVEEPKVKESVEKVVEKLVEDKSVVEKPVKPPEWKVCNRCRTVMVEVSKDGFEQVLECPKCKSRKSKC